MQTAPSISAIFWNTSRPTSGCATSECAATTCTESPENTELSQDIYRRLKDAGLIYTTDIEQFYDEEVGMFLADRFIKGTCPKCGAPDQYGDSCEKCSSVYSPTDLIDPYSAISGSVPVLKTSTHYFFRLSDPRAQAFLKEWTMVNGADGKPRVQAEVLAVRTPNRFTSSARTSSTSTRSSGRPCCTLQAPPTVFPITSMCTAL